MNVPKKVTDFIQLDAGNIGRKSAVVTGAALASSMLGALLVQTASAGDHCNVNETHYDGTWHENYWSPPWNYHYQFLGGHANHTNCY